MDFDFCLVASWGESVHRQLFRWAKELSRRGNQVAIVSPSDWNAAPSGVSIYSIPDLLEIGTILRNPADIEQEYDIPSLDHLTFTERQFFGLSRQEGLDRGVKVTAALEQFFSDHTVDRTVQVRGPEIHRLLMHYLTISAGGTSIWAGFSPFENTFSLQTTLDGTWDTYETIPYEVMGDDKRERTRDHIESYLDDQRFYSHESSTESRKKGLLTITSALSKVRNRQRPGTLHDQVWQEFKLKVQQAGNKRLFPGIKESRQLCENEQYLFFPLQYPIESRLTVFSPQFYDQDQLIEYLGRILPASVDLFVKPHPNHSGRPSPKTIRRFQKHDRIRVIHPSINAHTAIANSSGVVVTNNTVGFQTIYHRKPLFVLGSEFYAETPAAITPRTLGHLPECLSGHTGEETPLSTALSSIFSLREASYPGDRSDTSEDGVKTVVDSIKQFCADIDEN